MTSVRPILAAALLLGVVAAPVVAQTEAPRVELFGGYSILPADNQDFPRHTSHGVQAGVAANLTRWFGVFGEVAVQRSTATDLGPNFPGMVARSTVTEYLIGPRFTSRGDRVTGFVHGLFGLSRGDAGPDFEEFSDSGLTFGGGGGVDVRVSRRVAVRGQFDLLGSFADIVEGNSRLGVGVVVALK